MALARKNRLSGKKEFNSIFKNGKTVKGSFLFIKFVITGKQYPRFGISIPSKIYPNASDRNRLKRVISEELRDKKFPGGNFVLVILKKGKEQTVAGEAINLLNKIK